MLLATNQIDPPFVARQPSKCIKASIPTFPRSVILPPDPPFQKIGSDIGILVSSAETTGNGNIVAQAITSPSRSGNDPPLNVNDRPLLSGKIGGSRQVVRGAVHR